MKLKLKNKTNKMVNLGTRNGHMLNFNPNETKEVGETLIQDFEHLINRYVGGNFLEIVGRVEEKNNKKDLDLNGDGVFDEKDKSIAGKVLSTSVDEKKANVSKDNETFECDICGGEYNTERGLKIHKSRSH